MRQNFKRLFSDANMKKIFPSQKTAQFFEALFGDPDEGAYDIDLRFRDIYDSRIEFEFLLRARPGKCLSCSNTYGLPRVFSRHPVINIQEVVQKISDMIKEYARCEDWRLGATRTISPECHSIPLIIYIKPNGQ